MPKKPARTPTTNMFKTVISNRKANPKKFFSFIKSKKQDNIGVSILVDKGKSYITDIDMAEIFDKQFSSVFLNDDGICPRVNHPAAPSIGNLVVTPNGVRKLLDGLGPYKASGPDGVSARLLKECSGVITKGLVLLFNASLSQGKIPDDWRQALIAPIHTGGNINKTVSLTSFTCKFLEHIIHSHIISHLDRHNVLHNNQDGFRRKRSCETQLLKTVHDLAKTLNDKGQTDSILLDFSKAFDKVCHRKCSKSNIRRSSRYSYGPLVVPRLHKFSFLKH